MNQLIQFKNFTTVIVSAVALVCVGVSSKMQAVSPAPDGCYPNFTTAEGCDALNLLTTGAGNTGLGWRALFLDTTGNFNTAVGGGALALNNADSNTAVGTATMLLNTTGVSNVAIGTDALLYNDSGNFNTAVGQGALSANTSGEENTAVGNGALLNNMTGGFNTAIGDYALGGNTGGITNTAIGTVALGSNTIGSYNIALGFAAGGGVTTANNVIAIGTPGANVTNSCFIGHIRGVTTANADAIPVLIDSDGQLGTMSSSRRFKHEIKPIDKASEAILALNPVTFHYKNDATNTPQFGLIAEEVAEANPDLVVRDENGEIYTVRYDAVNAMLLNEFLKEHRKVEKLEATLKAISERLKEQDARIQKVSDQVQMSAPAAQMVVED